MAALDDLLSELFAPVGGVTMRRMFGGMGIFKDGLMFALMSSRGVVYFKADEATAPAFEAEGSAQWRPEMKGRTMAMPYWQVPDRLFDEPEEFAEWARTAFGVAEATRKAKTRPAGKTRSAGKAGKKRPARKRS